MALLQSEKYKQFDSAKFNTIVRDLYNSGKFRDEYPFLNKTAEVLVADDKDFDDYVRATAKRFTVDIVDGKQIEPVGVSDTDEEVFNIPNLKSGKRIEKKDWENPDLEAIAEELVKSIYLRMEAVIVQTISRGEILSPYIRIECQTHNQFQSVIEWDEQGSASLADIKVFVRQGYDRMTLSYASLSKIPDSDDFVEASGIDRRTLSVMKVEELIEVVKKVTKLKEVELYNKTMQTYNSENSKKPFSQRILRPNKVIFTKIADDKNKDVMDWGNAITTESVVSSLITEMPDTFGGHSFSPIGYFTGMTTGSEDLNPPIPNERDEDGEPVIKDIRAWVVCRGYVRIHNPNYSSVLEVYDDKKQETAQAS